ncbi:MAG TPA: hypothetical protein VGQ17_01780 [Gemmatimonadales bacterium]|jgi:hypothetical protein|nr:hypothetical protein [Gemmatimonadales bacterium]
MSNPTARLALFALLAAPTVPRLDAQRPAAPPAQQPKPAKPQVPAVGLATEGLAGQTVAVLPLTLVVTDPRIPGGGPRARLLMLRLADSLLGEALTERATEVKWLLPPDLRRIAQRSGGLMPSPDRMGQAVMKSPSLKQLPDPVRSYVRQLVALSGGARFALIPAALYLTPAGPQGDSLMVQLAAVLADGRLGRVVWRTMAVGRGETTADAVRAALSTIVAADSIPP